MSTPARDTAVHDLVIEETREGDDATLKLSGELDLASSNSLVEVVTRLCGAGARKIVLDIGPLVFIDSTGLRALLSSRAVCAEKDTTLMLAPAPEKVTPQVRRLLQVTGLLERLPFVAENQD
jgi:anti-sigma B factor antagonist